MKNKNNKNNKNISHLLKSAFIPFNVCAIMLFSNVISPSLIPIVMISGTVGIGIITSNSLENGNIKVKIKLRRLKKIIKKTNNLSNDTDNEKCNNITITHNLDKTYQTNKSIIATIPKAQLTLYGIYGYTFDSMNEIINFCNENDYSTDNIYKLEYIGDFNNRTDVISKEYIDGKRMLFSAVDEYGYVMYNNEHDNLKYEEDQFWTYSHGQLQFLHKIFKEKGISLKNDVYDNNNCSITISNEEQTYNQDISQKVLTLTKKIG